jgi:hypothetical protein
LFQQLDGAEGTADCLGGFAVLLASALLSALRHCHRMTLTSSQAQQADE